MSKRGMRAAGVCLMTVAVMSGSVVANGAVTPDGAVSSSDPTRRAVAEDFTVTYSASSRFRDRVRYVELRPDRVRPTPRYEIVVTHPSSIDQIDSAVLYLQRRDGSGFKHFRMRGVVENRPSPTSTILRGNTDYVSHAHGEKARARPGWYKVGRVRLRVTDGGDSIGVSVSPPSRRIHLFYGTKTKVTERSSKNGRVRFDGRVSAYTGQLGSKADPWSPLSGGEVAARCLRWKKKDRWVPTVVRSRTTDTDETGQFSLRSRTCRATWYVGFSGDGRFDSSSSDLVNVS